MWKTMFLFTFCCYDQTQAKHNLGKERDHYIFLGTVHHQVKSEQELNWAEAELTEEQCSLADTEARVQLSLLRSPGESA